MPGKSGNRRQNPPIPGPPFIKNLNKTNPLDPFNSPENTFGLLQ